MKHAKTKQTLLRKQLFLPLPRPHTHNLIIAYIFPRSSLAHAVGLCQPQTLLEHSSTSVKSYFVGQMGQLQKNPLPQTIYHRVSLLYTVECKL